MGLRLPHTPKLLIILLLKCYELFDALVLELPSWRPSIILALLDILYRSEAAVFCLLGHLHDFGQHSIADNKNDVSLDS